MSITTSIITVNYNSGYALARMLDSFMDVRRADLEMIVIDNASSDDSLERIGDYSSEIKLIKNAGNVGFGAAVNQGFSVGRGKFFLLLNPDAVLRDGSITELERFLEKHDGAGIAGGRVLEDDGTLQLACRRGIPTPWVAFCRLARLGRFFPGSRLFARYNMTYLDEREVNEVDAVSGSFMMLKREVVEELGGFDERFFLYAEDIDICYRAKQAGWKVYYTPDAVIVHSKGVSASSNPRLATYEFYNTMWTFHEKHFKKKTPFFINIPIYITIKIMKRVMPWLAGRRAR